jgi:hypothetical protein
LAIVLNPETKGRRDPSWHTFLQNLESLMLSCHGGKPCYQSLLTLKMVPAATLGLTIFHPFLVYKQATKPKEPTSDCPGNCMSRELSQIINH